MKRIGKQWGVCLYGEYSKNTTPITFYRFWRKENALVTIDRLNAKLPTYSHGDRVVYYCLYDYWNDVIHVQK